MNATIAEPRGSLSAWSSVAVWLAAFVSPSAYLLLLVFWNRLQVPAAPAGLIVALFCLIPVVAVLVCGTVVWRRKLTTGSRVAWLFLTVLAMALQVGVLLVIIVSAVTTAIALP